jgi:hypothetical protein
LELDDVYDMYQPGSQCYVLLPLLMLTPNLQKKRDCVQDGRAGRKTDRQTDWLTSAKLREKRKRIRRD